MSLAITIDQHDLERAIVTLRREFRAQPERFITAAEAEALPPEQYAERLGAYLYQILLTEQVKELTP